MTWLRNLEVSIKFFRKNYSTSRKEKEFKESQLKFVLFCIFYYFFNVPGKTVSINRVPTKEETSETTVQNLYCLFLYINDSLQSFTCLFAKSLNKPNKDHIQGNKLYLNLGSSYFQSSSQSHYLWITPQVLLHTVRTIKI